MRRRTATLHLEVKMKRIIFLLVFALLSASPHAAFAYGGTPVSVAAAGGVTSRIDCSFGRLRPRCYRDYVGKCVGPADDNEVQQVELLGKAMLYDKRCQ